MRRSVELPLSCAVLAAFSAVAFLEFYRTNMDSLEGPSRTAGCYFLTLAIAVAAALAAKVLFRSVSLARWLLIAAAISFMTFSLTA